MSEDTKKEAEEYAEAFEAAYLAGEQHGYRRAKMDERGSVIDISEIKKWLNDDSNILECLSILKVGVDQNNSFEGFRRAMGYVFAKLCGAVD
jgi:hypothetical protein